MSPLNRISFLIVVEHNASLQIGQLDGVDIDGGEHVLDVVLRQQQVSLRGIVLEPIHHDERAVREEFVRCDGPLLRGNDVSRQGVFHY